MKLLFVFVGVFAFAQHASVYDLTLKEQERGIKLFKEMNDATAAYNAWVDAMGAKYLKDGTGTVGCCSSKGHAEADFSEGFRHVMPKHPPTSGTIYTGGTGIVTAPCNWTLTN